MTDLDQKTSSDAILEVASNYRAACNELVAAIGIFKENIEAGFDEIILHLARSRMAKD